MSDSLSIYIHVPFCIKKCAYCDFYSAQDLSLIPAWAASLEKEIRTRTENYNAGILCQKLLQDQGSDSGNLGSGPVKKASTIYFGGGTPSLLPLETIEQILGTIHDCYDLAENVEITLEANPGTVDQSYLKGLANLGVNRLSIGVQSFDPGKLNFLNRIHSVAQSVQAIEWAQKAGFDNIGLDLIYALPNETILQWTRDLENALRFGPKHLSCYMLTLEPGTPLHDLYEKKIFLPCGQDMKTDLFMETSDFLAQNGFVHYEISNFALGRKNRSRHNSSYWNMTPYDGFGPSAHSFECQGLENPIRSWNSSDVIGYIRDLGSGRLPDREKEDLSSYQLMLEQVMLGLRTCDGLDVILFDTFFQSDFKQNFKQIIDQLEDYGLGRITKESVLEKSGTREVFRLTLAGWTRLDSIVEAFAEMILPA